MDIAKNSHPMADRGEIILWYIEVESSYGRQRLNHPMVDRG